MSYTKQHNYVDGTVLDASAQRSNDDEAKRFINQEAVQADLENDTFDFDSIEAGELDPITNHYHFMTGEDYGQSSGIDGVDRSYFTSNIKAISQTGANYVIWTPIYETGTAYEIEADADMIISFGGAFVSLQNQIQANGQWDSKIVLRYDDGSGWTDIEGTRSFTFEETRTASAGVKDPCDTSLSGIPYPASADPELCVRRWSGWTWHVSGLTAGTYKFAVFINSKVEEGFCSARSFTAEVFYT